MFALMKGLVPKTVQELLIHYAIIALIFSGKLNEQLFQYMVALFEKCTLVVLAFSLSGSTSYSANLKEIITWK